MQLSFHRRYQKSSYNKQKKIRTENNNFIPSFILNEILRKLASIGTDR